jgi:hypothetical protein
MRCAALLLALVLSGCVRAEVKVDGSWKPPTPHPTHEQIMKLAETSKPVTHTPTLLGIRAYPQVYTAGMTMRVTCTLPAHADGKYRFAIEGLMAQEGDVNKREISYIFRVACEPISAYCVYVPYDPIKGYVEPQRVTLDLEPSGDCK